MRRSRVLVREPWHKLISCPGRSHALFRLTLWQLLAPSMPRHFDLAWLGATRVQLILLTCATDADATSMFTCPGAGPKASLAALGGASLLRGEGPGCAWGCAVPCMGLKVIPWPPLTEAARGDPAQGAGSTLLQAIAASNLHADSCSMDKAVRAYTPDMSGWQQACA